MNEQETLTEPGQRTRKKRLGRNPKPVADLVDVGRMFQPKKTAKKTDHSIPDENRLFNDFRTYCEELLWIRNKRGEVIPFKWNQPQIDLYEYQESLRQRGRMLHLILKYRRFGCTTLQQARSFFLTANNENQYAATLAHDNQSTQKIFDISLMFYNKLAPWARPTRKTENKKEINFSGLGSVFYIGTAGGQSFGRGQTIQRIHGSESAFWPKSVDHAVLVAGLLEACSHGEVDFETTANGHGNWFHKTWNGAKEGLNDWVPIFLAWYNDMELTIPTTQTLEQLSLTTKEEELVKVYNLMPSQILWRRDKMRKLYDPDLGYSLFHQEYPINDVEAFISTGNCFFDQEIVQHLANLCREPIYTGDQGRLKVYEESKTYRTYTVSADIGEGVPGGNRTVIVVLDNESCEEVCGWAGICSPEECAGKMAELGKLYNSALLAPEANNFGHSTINTLMNQIGYPYIFTATDYQTVRIENNIEVTPKKGWQTNLKTRPILLAEFRTALQNNLYHANDKQLLSECLTFVNNGHGKYEAAKDAFDDRVFAHAIAFQARKQEASTGSFAQYAVDTGQQSISSQWEEIL